MEHRLSSRVRAIAPSATMSVDAKTKALLDAGRPVINMSVGEPDFDTPVPAAYAGIRAITHGQTKYTAAAGTVALRRAIAKKLQEENGLTYTPEQIVVSCGAKHSLFNVFMTLCDPGDEVIIPAPYWVTYPEQVRLVGAVPVIVQCDESTGFKMTPAQLEQAFTERTRVVLLNSPCNPTGAVYSRSELLALAEVLVRHDAYILADEIYERLVYGVEHLSIAALKPELMPRTVVVNGFSKAFAMTGWRLGYAAAELPIAKAMASLQSHGAGSPSTISQAAGVAALDAFDPAMVAEFKRRRDVLVEGLQSLPGVQCLMPDGAFYVFPNIGQLLQRRWRGEVIGTATRFCELLLEHELVAAVPGEAFGAPHNIRLSYATHYDNVVQAVERIRRFVEQLD